MSSPALVLAAHGTRSGEGLRTTRSLVAALAAARPDVPVTLGFLDVAAPTLVETLDALAGAPAVVVPLLLSAGYHVTSDIPSIVADRPSTVVAAHLGPDRLIVDAVAARLTSVSGGPPTAGTVVLAAIASSRSGARSEVACAAAGLSAALGRDVAVLPLIGDLDSALAALTPPVAVATYLLAEGDFLTQLRATVSGRGVVADPIGVHEALVALVWARYDEAAGPPGPVR